jgi:hypothetical protein
MQNARRHRQLVSAEVMFASIFDHDCQGAFNRRRNVVSAGSSSTCCKTYKSTMVHMLH